MNAAAAAAYRANSVTTASPVRLLLMLCDRLVLDIERALRAQMSRDRAETHNQLIHAQAIVTELQNSLKPEAFKGGEQLAALYRWLEGRLVEANLRNDQRATGDALSVAKGIRDTWHEAATHHGGS